ncbi:MAG: DUF2852 domain-containing protein [Roseiarcus sp.]
MSNAQNAFGGGPGPEDWSYGQGSFAGRRCLGRWTAFDGIAVVVGLIVFWPIGLALIGYKLWQARMGGPDLQTLANQAWAKAREAWTSGHTNYRAWAPSSGNSAFDAWKAAELARLEEERRRLEQAHREFAEFMETVRRAKDREEFDRFMAERRSRQGL